MIDRHRQLSKFFICIVYLSSLKLLYELAAARCCGYKVVVKMSFQVSQQHEVI